MATENRVAYLQKAYADEGNVLRTGDRLHDMQVDYAENTRLLGLIGRNDVTLAQTAVVNGSVPLAYLSIEQDGEIVFSYVTYATTDAKFYGLDVNLTGVRQAVKIELYGYTCLSVVTVNA